MNRSATVFLFSLALTMAATVQATPVTVTFEDVPATGIADGYGGISGWSQAGSVVNGAGEGIDDYLFYGPTSTGELRFDGAPVVFHGTYYKSYAADWANPITSISLFYQGQLVHSILDPLVGGSLEWVASGYGGLVDTLRFQGGLEGFAIDNLSYEVATASVPEPGVALLMLSGLGMLGVVARRRSAPGKVPLGKR
ncbi:MAG: PEP-CTERM sorting domain-containing protein [Gallionellaceae bacterium]|nr:PEP-CTERM sorting domain-containing protein [Gallionellaceae bacterium]